MNDMTEILKMAVASSIALLTWWGHQTWQRLGRLDVRMQKVELEVAGQYVTRQELQEALRALWKRLDRIEAKLDAKVDK